MTARQIRFAGAVARCGSLAAARREEPFSDSWLWFLMRDECFCEHLRFIGVDEATIESCVRESEAFVRKKSGGETCGSGASEAKSGAETRGSGASVAKSGAEARGSGASEAKLGAEASGSGANAAKSGAEACGSGVSEAKSGAEARGSGVSAAKSGAEVRGSGASVAKSGAEARGSGADKADSRVETHKSGVNTSDLGINMHESGAKMAGSGAGVCKSGASAEDLSAETCLRGADAAKSGDDACIGGAGMLNFGENACTSGAFTIDSGVGVVRCGGGERRPLMNNSSAKNGDYSVVGGSLDCDELGSGGGSVGGGSLGGRVSANRDVSGRGGVTVNGGVSGSGGTSGGDDDPDGLPVGEVSANRDVSGCGEATVNGVVSGSGGASGSDDDQDGLPVGEVPLNRDVSGRGGVTVNGGVSGSGGTSGGDDDPDGLPVGGVSGDGDDPGGSLVGEASVNRDDPGGTPGGDAERELLSEIRGLRAAAMRDKSLKLADRLGAASALERSLLEGTSVADEERVRFRLPADAIGRAFVDINRKIVPNVSYIFTGGRCSGKSSFIALKIIEIMLGEPTIHACAVRKLATTLRDSVYAQFEWAIRELGLTDKFRFKYSPLEIVYIPTGQTIFFRGVDDAAKLKSTRPPFGTIGILWREEADQLSGPDEARGIAQSVLRGGGVAYDFSSYNPPRSKKHWINALPDGGAVRHHSTYLELPEEWVGRKFLDDAEHLRVSDPAAYEHEYLGVPNGVGGAVFEKLEVRRITDEEIGAFDRIYQGIDFGWYPDPLAFLRLHYDAARERIYLIDELYGNKIQNSEAADFIISRGYDDERIVCDSAEPRSIAELRRFGVPAVGAVKGAGSVAFGFRWLAARTIVVDPERTPKAYAELAAYELSPEGDFPDRDDHAISALRYATERIRA